jgi:hypothetical protein
MKRFRFRRGATLPELMVVIGSFAFLLAGVIAMGVNSASEWGRGSTKLIADNDASIALQKLGREVRNGIRCYTNTSRDQLWVVMPVTNAQGDYDRFTESASHVRFYRSNGNLYRQVGSGTASVLAREVDSINFQVNGTQVEIQLRCRKEAGIRYGETTLETQVTLRNEPV